MAWGSRSFNGTSDIITLGAGFDAASSAGGFFPVSASCWINPSGTGSRAIIGAGGNVKGGLEWRVDSGSTISILSQDLANLATSSGTVSNSVWTPVGFTLSASTGGNYAFYINGSVSGSGTVGAGTLVAGQTPYILGQNGFDLAEFFSGSMADFAYWGGASLTAAEFSALSRGERPTTIRPLSLKSYLPLDGLQSPEPDLSGNKNNGTLTGTTPAFGPPYTPFTPRWPQPLDFIPPPLPFTLMPQIVT